MDNQTTTEIHFIQSENTPLILSMFMEYLKSKSFKIQKSHPKNIPGQYSALPDIEFDVEKVVSDFMAQQNEGAKDKMGDYWVECDVCKTQYKNWAGSTPCCGAISWMVDVDMHSQSESPVVAE